MGQVESCDGTQGNSFGSSQVGSCGTLMAPKEKCLGGSGRFGSCYVRAPEEMHSGRSSQVRSCEGAQGNVFRSAGLVRVGSCELGHPRKHVHVGRVRSCEGT